MKENMQMLVVLTLFALLSGLVLTITYQVTAPYIELHSKGALDKSIAEVLGAVSAIEKKTIADNELYTALDAKGQHYAAIISSANGYGGPVKVMVGMNLDLKEITKISILEHTETPGLGTIIEEDMFKDRFNNLIFNSQGNIKVDTISGATLSTTAVKKAVEKAILFATSSLYDENGRINISYFH